MLVVRGVLVVRCARSGVWVVVTEVDNVLCP